MRDFRKLILKVKRRKLISWDEMIKEIGTNRVTFYNWRKSDKGVSDNSRWKIEKYIERELGLDEESD